MKPSRRAVEVLVRGRLLAWCRDTCVECTPFETLHVVAARLS